MYKSLLFFFLSSFLVLSENNVYSWVGKIPKPWELSQKDLDFYLQTFHKKYPDVHERLIAMNIWRVGTPYGIFCLEEKGYDKDPIIRIDTSDCTVHVLTSIAFAKGKSFNEARNAMISLHYKPDENGKIEPTYKSDGILHLTVY